MMRYTEDHEWIDLNGDTGTVGISPHAIEQLGDIVFVELPEAGSKVARAPRMRQRTGMVLKADAHRFQPP